MKLYISHFYYDLEEVIEVKVGVNRCTFMFKQLFFTKLYVQQELEGPQVTPLILALLIVHRVGLRECQENVFLRFSGQFP